MSDPETIAVYDAQADDYERMMRVEAEEQTIWQAFVAAFPEGGAVLDLGCGPGNYARLFAQAGLKVTALDASAEMARRAAQIKGVTARHGVFDHVAEVDAYDGIWASFSLLHAPRADLPRHLSALRRALKPGGRFFIGMKTGTGGGRDDLGRFYEYYSNEELEALLRTAGFAPQRNWTGYGKGLAGQYSGWVVIDAHG
ncbi:methyltransferase domain-containing protein [Sulfitobacter sp. F26204]|uniref:class I SAM-dependent DNA methyltransferase n=1 Tax=Sulfitobacter sp. F26204 TaxID=2996014 RepID=UPI00225E45D1|nr:class I SAM-dependent methyltransferase [Sulfitobacter sp. F26204]MCX7558642.1 methyltransferase domain-containing protein [Sulfitobacter sp. F26204]